MTSDGASVSSEGDFAAELQMLLNRAHENGVELRGGWECRNGPEYPDWDVVVTEIATEDAE